MAAFMACGHAKWTGDVGVCLATSGPGAIHLLNGLYDAKLDHQPVVAIVGQQARAALGGSYQQEVDLPTLFKDVASEYVQLVTEPSQVRHVVDRALRIALAERTVTCMILPNDLQTEPAEEPPREHGTIHSGLGYNRPEVVPHAEDLERAAELLNAGERVAMLVGQGALEATAEVVETAELLGAGVAKALLGKAAVPDELPFVTGSVGLLGTRPSWELMTGCDTLLMVGTSFPTRSSSPRRAGHAESRSTSSRADSESATRRRSTSSATAPPLSGHCGRTCSGRTTDPGETRSRRTSPTGGRCWRSARSPTPTRSTRNAFSGSCRRACRTTASSPPTRALSRTGLRAT
jgi:thiamine pyrophosphate-dependent acetolactate synthase large subunit-like protein